MRVEASFAPNRDRSLLRHPGLAQAVVKPVVKFEDARILVLILVMGI